MKWAKFQLRTHRVSTFVLSILHTMSVLHSKLGFVLIVIASISFVAQYNHSNESQSHWPQFRGYRAKGLVSGATLPTSWNIQSGENVLWAADIPGLAHASPIIWKNRIYVATAVSETKAELKVGLYGDINSAEDQNKQQWRLMAFDKTSGELIWNQLGYEGIPTSKRHPKATHCNSTPATNGEFIAAIFGSEGLFCFDMNGQLQWKKGLGDMIAGFFQVPSTQWGYGSSPVIHEGNVIVQCDVLEKSFLAAYDLKSGDEIWRIPREEVSTWSTPTIVDVEGKTQILVNGWHHIGAYDFETGQEIWKLDGGGDIPVPTPVTAHGLAFFTSAHGRYRPIRAVDLNAKGDITPPRVRDTNEAIAWMHERKGNYMQTPIVVGENLYACFDNGVLTCFDAKSGEIQYRERLGMGGRGFTASPVSDGHHIYFTGEAGQVFVVPAGDEYSLSSVNKLNDNCLATPAISDGVLYFRTQHKLIAIGEKKE